MQTREFGKTQMQITPIGLGAWAIGGSGWGSQDDQESIETIRKALDLGINWIDTAAIYGNGRSEKVVGQAIKGRERPFIFTKCSLVWDENDKVSNNLKADSIRREVEASLKRLDIDVIDLYQIHWPNPDSDIEEGWSTLLDLKKEGKVRHVGVSNFNVEQLERVGKLGPVETLQPPYSAVHSEAGQEILPYCQKENIGVIVYSPMSSGLLTGKMSKDRVAKLSDEDWRKKNSAYKEPRLSRNLELADLLTEIGKSHQVSTGVVAIGWTLHNPGVTAAIVGARHPQQIEELAAANDFQLSDDEFEQIQKFLEAHP